MCVGLCFCFFFFKQKTAYEMRISDWSSDVCSSDLLCVGQRRALLHGGRDRIIAGHLTGPLGIADHIGTGRGAFTGKGALHEPAIQRGMTPVIERGEQNGRASCRERGWQYV